MNRKQTIENGNTVTIRKAGHPWDGIRGEAVGFEDMGRIVLVATNLSGEREVDKFDSYAGEVEKATGVVSNDEFRAALDIITTPRRRVTADGHSYLPEIQILVDANWAYDPDPFYMMSDQFLSRGVALTPHATVLALAMGYTCRCCGRLHNPKDNKGFCSSCHNPRFDSGKKILGADGKLRCGAHHLHEYPDAMNARKAAHAANDKAFPLHNRRNEYRQKADHRREAERINAEVYDASARVVQWDSIPETSA